MPLWPRLLSPNCLASSDDWSSNFLGFVRLSFSRLKIFHFKAGNSLSATCRKFQPSPSFLLRRRGAARFAGPAATREPVFMRFRRRGWSLARAGQNATASPLQPLLPCSSNRFARHRSLTPRIRRAAQARFSCQFVTNERQFLATFENSRFLG
jgi:hypothetical protein